MKLGLMRKRKWFRKFRNYIHVYLVVMEDVIALGILQNILHIPFWNIILIKSFKYNREIWFSESFAWRGGQRLI